LTREKALKELKEAQGFAEDYEFDSAHIMADTVLCDLLISLGYEDVVEEYYKVGKWYSCGF